MSSPIIHIRRKAPRIRRHNTYTDTRAFALSLFAVLVLVLAGSSVNSRAPQMSAVASHTLIVLANEYRMEEGAPLLTENSLLTSAAEEKAQDMAERSYFSHQTPEGDEPWVFLDRAGYAYAVAGENLAVNFSESETVTNAWMNSPTHRANIVNREFTEIGVGVAQGVYKGHPATFVVQFFAQPALSH